MDPFYIVKWKWALLLTQCTWTTELYHQSKVPLDTSDARKKLGIYGILCPEIRFFLKNAQFSNALLTTFPTDLWKLFLLKSHLIWCTLCNPLEKFWELQRLGHNSPNRLCPKWGTRVRDESAIWWLDHTFKSFLGLKNKLFSRKKSLDRTSRSKVTQNTAKIANQYFSK